ncbi:MAG TPA: type II toxin-antitoxin system RelE/ParE family toxin [Bryobacteraceae bacterium]|nr:type II toxin-antitoxin system RelE/ParE family toxin [Bryobacteraceae bacterium]
MRIRWTPAAAADLQSISEYLKEHHPRYRNPTMRKLYETIRELKQWPARGRPGREVGTREILFPPTPYVAVYRVKDQTIEVVRIYHAAQEQP